MSKYNAQKSQGFDSKKEARRYSELRILEKSGLITDLQRQVPFEIIPAQKDKKGRTLERASKYIADFVYFDDHGYLVVEDVKGYRKGTAYAVFVLKRKLMLQKYGIRVLEV